MNTGKDWYLYAKYGIYMTLSYEGFDINPIPRRYLDKCGCFYDGRLPKNINEIADAFDVIGFADFCAEIGIQYVNFTLYHAHIYTLCPNPTLDRWLPGHTSRRDVIRELLDELHKRGIRLQLYIHSTVGDTMTDEEREMTGYNEPEGHFKRWNDFVNEVFTDIFKRYGTDMDSYYIDMIFDRPFLTMIDVPRLRHTFDTYAPGVVIVGNGEANDLVDYSSREDCSVFIPDMNNRFSTAVQHVILLPTHKEKGWWSTVSSSHEPVSAYTPDHLYRALAMNIGSNRCGGGVAFGFGPYCESGFEPGIADLMKALWQIIKPVSESIKDTYPSPSYPLPSGVSLPSLPFGISAVTDKEGKYEYIHVLTPPSSNTLSLPAPLDGCLFDNAVLLPDGIPLRYESSSSGLKIDMEGEWRYPDTVIRLERNPAAVLRPTASHTLPDSALTVSSCDETQGHEASCLNDGNPKTFWQTSSGNIHTIDIRLDREYEVCALRVAPLPDTSPDALEKHIAIYSLWAYQGGEKRAVTTGEWKRSADEKICSFAPIRTSRLTLVCGPDWFLGYEHKTDAASALKIEVC